MQRLAEAIVRPAPPNTACFLPVNGLHVGKTGNQRGCAGFLWKYIDGKEEESMLDMVMILLTAGIFGLLVGFAHWCDRIEKGEDRS